MNILMLVAPEEFWETEYFVPHSIFVEKNINVTVTTAGNSAEGAQGTIIRSDIDISKVDVKNYDALFVVGGKGMIKFSDNKEAQRIFKEFIEDKKPVALICHGPLLAIKSIPMVNKQITGWPEIRSDIEASGARYTGMPLERDGDIFTAVGPEDAESLANVLIHRLENDPVLTDTLLDEKTAMLKLAWIWRMADSISDEEAERWLKQFEREEFANLEEKQPGKTTVEQPVQPTIPVQKVVFDPARIKQKQIYKSKHPWNIVINLQPPKTDGSWPEISEVPPAGFPFTLNELKDGASIGELFRKPETWEKLKEVAANPTKRDTIQSYLVPLMVLVIGKTWWDNNKNKKRFGNAPFGLFSQEEYKRLKDGKIPLEETNEGRAIISMINWHVSKILQFYLATGNIEKSDLDGYIYKSLKIRMMREIGKNQGLEAQQKPICAYCRFKRVLETTPPILSEIGIHKAQGKKRALHIYKCPTCEKVIEEKEQTLKTEEQNFRNFQESLKNMENNIQELKNELNKDPENKELKSRLISYESMLTDYRLQAEDSQKEWQNLYEEVRNRKNMQHVSTTHIGCINEMCPGFAIPITFVDWDNAFWNTNDGKKAREELLNTYNVNQPEGLKTEQKAEDVTNVQQKRDLHTPPTWMWHVPFYCPFDNSHFTPKEAFGKGRPGLDGTRMGGLFVTYPRTLIWDKPLSLEEQNMSGGEAKHQRLEEIRSLTGITTTTQSGSFLNDQEQKLEDKQMSEILRQVLVYQNKTRRVKKTKKMGSLIDTLYDALLDFSYIHPLHLVRYFTNRKPLGVKEVITDDGKIERHLATLPSGTAQQVESPVVQIWFTKILKQYGEQKGITILQKEQASGGYLTNYERDKIWPDSFFLTNIKSDPNGRLYATCELKSTSKTRGPGYGIQPYMALVRDIWAYDGNITQEQKEISIDKTTGSQLVVGKTGRRFEMESHDPRQIYFDTSTNFKEGDSIIVRALFMPWHTAWRALRDIKDIRQASQQYMENAPSYIGSLRMWNAIKDGDKDTIINSIVKKLKSKKISEELKQKYDKILQELKNKTEPLTEREVQLLEALMGETNQKAEDMIQDAKDPLSTYKGKREFDKTPEPEGKEEKGQNKHRFVIQLHHALKAKTHFDLRLENEDGTLSSWSIPKHHLPKGKEKLLAIKTEDHPIKYLKFKGSIPVGSYGAGEMEIHDSGTYKEIEFGKTKIVFKLNGKKEKGTYKLFRAGKDKNWLIMEDSEKKEASYQPLSKRSDDFYRSQFTFSPNAPSHRPGEWMNYKFPGGGTYITPKLEEEEWKKQQPKQPVEEEKEPNTIEEEQSETEHHVQNLPNEKRWHLIFVGFSPIGWCKNLEVAENIKSTWVYNFSQHGISPVSDVITNESVFSRSKSEEAKRRYATLLFSTSEDAKELREFIAQDLISIVATDEPEYIPPENFILDEDSLPDYLDLGISRQIMASAPYDVKGQTKDQQKMKKILERIARYLQEQIDIDKIYRFSKLLQFSKRANKEKSCWEYMKIFLGEKYEEWLKSLKKPIKDEQCEEELDKITEELVNKYFQQKEVVEKYQKIIKKFNDILSNIGSYDKLDPDLINKWDKAEQEYSLWKERMDNTAYKLTQIGVKTGSQKLQFSKRAILERLPIHLDPALWTNEQIIDAVQQPELFGNDKERFQLAIEQLAKRGLAKKIEPKDIGKWLEHGKFMLLWSGSPLALYKTKEQAERAKRLLVSDFAEQGKFPPFTQGGQIGWKSMIVDGINHGVGHNFDNFMDFDMWHSIDNQSQKEVEGRLLNPKTNEKDRKEYAESALNIVKLPQTANIPDKNYSVSDRPNEIDSIHTSDYLFSDPNDYKFIDDIINDSQKNESKGREKFIEQAVKTVKKRIDAQKAGFDPEKLADDDALELALISDEDTDI